VIYIHAAIPSAATTSFSGPNRQERPRRERAFRERTTRKRRRRKYGFASYCPNNTFVLLLLLLLLLLLFSPSAPMVSEAAQRMVVEAQQYIRACDRNQTHIQMTE
jgi:hypothetical protein